MKKILSILLALAMILSLSPAAFAADTQAIRSKDMSFYLDDLDDVKTYPVYFMGDSDVPYFSLADWAELMTYLMHTYVNKDQDISFETRVPRIRRGESAEPPSHRAGRSGDRPLRRTTVGKIP